MEKQGSVSSNIIYISHGGGPMPLLGERGHLKMVDFLGDLPEKIDVPEEILVISAHWEEVPPVIYSAEKQELLYDYYGFPPESYEIKYPTAGNSDLAALLQDSLGQNGFAAAVDQKRGLDHGVFIPLKLMYPDGGIPVTQLSLVKGLNASTHIRLGQALRPLLGRKILVIGSGFSFHNMRMFAMGGSEADDPQNNGFQDWLISTCSETDEPETILDALENWKAAPGARYCHPREEHLLPLHVCAGLAGKKAELIFDDFIAGKRSVGFLWQF